MTHRIEDDARFFVIRKAIVDGLIAQGMKVTLEEEFEIDTGDRNESFRRTLVGGRYFDIDALADGVIEAERKL